MLKNKQLVVDTLAKMYSNPKSLCNQYALIRGVMSNFIEDYFTVETINFYISHWNPIIDKKNAREEINDYKIPQRVVGTIYEGKTSIEIESMMIAKIHEYNVVDQNLVICAVFMLCEGMRRTGDYINMYLFQYDDEAEIAEDIRDNDNYINVSQKYGMAHMRINKFKTRDRLPQYNWTFDGFLYDVINEFSKTHKYLIEHQGQPPAGNDAFTKIVNRAFKTVCGIKKITPNDIRHIRADAFHQIVRSSTEKKEYAIAMGHSTAQNEQYRINTSVADKRNMPIRRLKLKNLEGAIHDE